MKYRLFKRKKSNQFFFQILTDNDVKVLNSEGYEAKEGRNNGLRSVVENGGNAGRYEKRTDGGNHYFILKAKNGQEIARSESYGSEGDVDASITTCIAEIPKLAPGGDSGSGGTTTTTGGTTTTTTTTTTVETAAGTTVTEGSKMVAANRTANIEIDAPPPPTGDAAPKKKRKKRTGPKKEKVEKVYLANGEYYFNEITYQVFRSGNGKHYFTFKNAAEKTIFLNASVRGYDTQEEAENGVVEVMRYSPFEGNYEGKTTKNGKYYFYITDGKGTNLGKSFFYKTTEDMQVAIGTLLGDAAAIAAAQASGRGATGTAAAATTTKASVDEYLDCAAYAGGAGFHKFEKDGEHYFGFNDDTGNTILRSEGYTSESGRDNGIESVKKNAVIEKRWSTVEEGGKFFRILKAGNHQEIGRSCPATSADGPAWAWMWGSFSVTKAVAPAEPIADPEPIVFETAAAAKGSIDEYLDCAAYAGGTGFHKFEKGGEHYFGYNDDNGNTILRSEGYTTEKARDNGIESVKKNAVIEKRWSTVEEDGKFFRILKAGNHQEIGRSCPATSADGPAWAWMWGSFSVTKAVAPAEPIADPEPIVFETAAAAKGSIDEYLDCAAYAGGTGFHKFEKGGEHYFGYNDDNGNTILRSEGYTTEKARDNGIESVKKNAVIEKRWSTVEEDGKFFRILKAGNHQEIGRSCPASSASGPAWAWMWGSFAVSKAVAPSTPAPEPEPIVFETAAEISENEASEVVIVKKSHEEKEDDYLACKEYEGKTVTDTDNNIASFKHSNGQYYFVVYNEDGSVMFRSEGFESEANRQVELDGAITYMGNADMMRSIVKGKYSMNILYDQEGREVGRSCLIKEEDTPGAKFAAAAAATAGVAATIPAESVVEAKSQIENIEKKEDDYLACEAYEGHPVNDKINNVALFKHENGQFYFVVYDTNGGVKIRSEGFQNTKTRDVELSGVLKNQGDDEMYKTIGKGDYRIHVLYDTTGREVGRSCLEKMHHSPVVEEAAAPVAEVAAAAALVAAAAPVVVKKTQEEKEDDYLPCKEYEGHTITDKKNNIALFKHKNGQFYFVVYNEDGSVRLRSEGFNSTENRKVELDGVIAYLGNKDMTKTIKRGKYSMVILYDHEGREVGRSCLIKAKEAAPVVAAAAAAPVVAAATAAATAAAAAASTVKVEKEVDKEDDYIACKEYEGRKVNDKQNNVALFKHKNGQFYFAVYRPDGSVRLRSEGFRKAKQRDVELSGVLRNINKEDMYKTITKAGHSMHILYDKTGREVGRSCLEKVAQPIIPVATVAKGAAAAAVVAAAASTAKAEPKPKVIKAAAKKVTVATGKKKAAAATVAAASTGKAAAATASSGGGFNWWWLLALLPLLLLFICYFTDCCTGCGQATTVAPKVEAPVTPPVVEEIVETPPPPPPAAACACGGNANSIFNPMSGTPKSLSRLGTNPEFGNSHGLEDGAAFYAKLQKASSSSARDKKFLNDLFVGMGYSGFGDASADMFSETRLRRGQTGNMGAGSKHRTIHAKLDVTSDSDLEAFRIEAKNGCHMHFMKTCGNHFFFCQN